MFNVIPTPTSVRPALEGCTTKRIHASELTSNRLKSEQLPTTHRSPPTGNWAPLQTSWSNGSNIIPRRARPTIGPHIAAVTQAVTKNGCTSGYDVQLHKRLRRRVTKAVTKSGHTRGYAQLTALLIPGRCTSQPTERSQRTVCVVDGGERHHLVCG